MRSNVNPNYSLKTPKICSLSDQFRQIRTMAHSGSLAETVKAGCTVIYYANVNKQQLSDTHQLAVQTIFMRYSLIKAVFFFNSVFFKPSRISGRNCYQICNWPNLIAVALGSIFQSSPSACKQFFQCYKVFHLISLVKFKESRINIILSS